MARGNDNREEPQKTQPESPVDAGFSKGLGGREAVARQPASARRRRISRGLEKLSRAVRAELAQCVEQGLTAAQTRRRLAIHGAARPERTISRLLAAVRAEQRRISDLEAIGRGLGSVQIGATGAAEILRASAPDWRRKQVGALNVLFQQFLEAPTGELYSGLAVGMHAFLLGTKLSEFLKSDG